MTCEETQHLFDAYLDDEVDLPEKLAIENHLKDCRSCARILLRLRELVSALRKGALRFKAPAHLMAMVQAGMPRTNPRVHRSIPYWQWAGAAAALILIVALAWVVPARTRQSSMEAQLIGEIVSNHVRSMMANHLTDIASSDSHNVKPWFADKLDFSPQVMDLSEQGFPLIGGRMDYLDKRPVAALVYRHNQHLMNLFVWPADESLTRSETQFSIRGYNLIRWNQNGMTYWLISDLNPAEMSEFAGVLRQ